MAGNYFGEAIASIYASGGASATTLNTGVAKMFTKYARGTIKGPNRGIGWNIKFKKYTLRVMTERWWTNQLYENFSSNKRGHDIS